MTTLCIIAVAVLGVNVGWERLPEGGMQYVIQLDAQSLEALRAGQAIESDVPPSAGEVRSYRIIAGTARLRRDAPQEGAKPASQDSPSREQATSPEKAAVPKPPWLVTLLALFASLGTNVFLGWLVLGLRRRCRETTAAV